MKTGKIHAADIKKSVRLQRARDFLLERGERGATTMEWILGAMIGNAGATKKELIENGIPVTCTREGKNENGNLIFRYRIEGAAC